MPGTTPEVDTVMRATGAQQLRSAAFGMGVADGKGRLKVVADIGTLSTDRPIPIIANDISATSVGEPRSLFLVSIPDPAEFRRLEALALGYLPPEAGAQWDGIKAMMTEAMGVSIEETLEAIGPELVYFTDRAGEFVGLKVRDQDLLDDVLERLSVKFGTPLEERRVDGQTIRYVSMPGMPGLPAELFAVFRLVQAGLLRLGKEFGDRDAVLVGDPLEGFLHLARRDCDLGLNGRALLHLFVDQLVDQTLVELGDGGVALRPGWHALVDLKQERLGALAQIGEQDRSLADDGDHALDQRRPCRTAHEREQQGGSERRDQVGGEASHPFTSSCGHDPHR